MQRHMTDAGGWATAGQDRIMSGLLIALLAASASLVSVQALAEKPVVIYAGREKPQPREERYPHYRVINQSAGYGYPAYGRPQTDVNVQLRYQAPSTTIINNNVQVIPPSVPVGNISYSQDTYYINTAPQYPDYRRPHQHRRYINSAVQDDEQPQQPVQDRSRQWTQDVGVTLP